MNESCTLVKIIRKIKDQPENKNSPCSGVSAEDPIELEELSADHDKVGDNSEVLGVTQTDMVSELEASINSPTEQSILVNSYNHVNSIAGSISSADPSAAKAVIDSWINSACMADIDEEAFRNLSAQSGAFTNKIEGAPRKYGWELALSLATRLSQLFNLDDDVLVEAAAEPKSKNAASLPNEETSNAEDDGGSCSEWSLEDMIVKNKKYEVDNTTFW